MSNGSMTDTYANVPDKSQQAPDFELPDTNMKTHRLSDYKGKKMILAFFPAENPQFALGKCVILEILLAS